MKRRLQGRDLVEDAKSIAHANRVLLANALDGDVDRPELVEARWQIELLSVADLCLLLLREAIDVLEEIRLPRETVRLNFCHIVF